MAIHKQRLLGGAFLALLLPLTLLGVELPENACPLCDTPACNLIAKPTPWPHSATPVFPGQAARPLSHLLTINLGFFSVQVPPNPVAITYAPHAITVRYSDHALTFSLIEKTPDADAAANTLRDLIKASHWSWSDRPTLLFMKTPRDAEPTDFADRQVWRAILLSKSALLGEATHTWHAQKDHLRLYYTEADLPKLKRAFLIDTRLNDVYLMVTAENYPFRAFLTVLGTITSTDPP